MEVQEFINIVYMNTVTCNVEKKMYLYSFIFLPSFSQFNIEICVKKISTGSLVGKIYRDSNP
jgi:hypothetical protein